MPVLKEFIYESSIYFCCFLSIMYDYHQQFKVFLDFLSIMSLQNCFKHMDKVRIWIFKHIFYIYIYIYIYY